MSETEKKKFLVSPFPPGIGNLWKEGIWGQKDYDQISPEAKKSLPQWVIDKYERK